MQDENDVTGSRDDDRVDERMEDGQQSDDVFPNGQVEDAEEDFNESDESDEENEVENEPDHKPEELTNTKPDAEATVKKSTAPARKGRGMTGYMLFLKENRSAIKEELGEGKAGLKEVAKLAAEKWRALLVEDRISWNEKAKLVEVEPKETREQGPEEDKLALPISKIREILKKDPDVKNVQAPAVKLLAKATELFAEDLCHLALNCGDHKRIRLIDVHHIIHANDEKFGFLAYDFETPAQIVEREGSEARKKKQMMETTTTSSGATRPAGKSIASFFSTTKKTEAAYLESV